MNKVVRIGEGQGCEILDNYFPAIVRWSEDSRAQWQTCMDTDSYSNFCIFLQVCRVDKNFDLAEDNGWWFSYQNYVEFEFEDGTIKSFEVKHGDCFTDDRETFKELVDFIDDYVNNGYELCDKTTVVLDEDELLVV